MRVCVALRCFSTAYSGGLVLFSMYYCVERNSVLCSYCCIHRTGSSLTLFILYSYYVHTAAFTELALLLLSSFLIHTTFVLLHSQNWLFSYSLHSVFILRSYCCIHRTGVTLSSSLALSIWPSYIQTYQAH